MNIKSILAISGIILVTALGTCWIITPHDPTPEELYRQYMQLSPVERMEVKYTLLAKAAHAGHLPAIWQMAEEPGCRNIFKSRIIISGSKKPRIRETLKGSLKHFTYSICRASKAWTICRKLLASLMAPRFLNWGAYTHRETKITVLHAMNKKPLSFTGKRQRPMTRTPFTSYIS